MDDELTEKSSMALIWFDFHYDIIQERKSKVFTDLQYVFDLNLPVHVNDEPINVVYSLYAIGENDA